MDRLQTLLSPSALLLYSNMGTILSW
eukprot:COSAG05_NODE_18721_length_304_cov_0.707317_1_plen_25_part_10